MKFTKAHDDTVAKALGMLHVMIWVRHQVIHHLDRLTFDEGKMVLGHHVLHKELVHKLAALAPVIRILHQKKMVAI